MNEWIELNKQLRPGTCGNQFGKALFTEWIRLIPTQQTNDNLRRAWTLEILSRGSPYLEVYSFWKRNQQFTYSLCAQLTYASSNSRTEQAYSLLMNKFMFTVSKTSLKLASSASICWTPFTLSGWYHLRWILECQMGLWNVMVIELEAISKFVTEVANLWPKMVFPLFSPY